MTNNEFSEWIAFYRDFPFDDYNRFHRPASFIATSNFTRNRDSGISDALEWLQPAQVNHDFNEVDLSIIKALGGKKR